MNKIKNNSTTNDRNHNDNNDNIHNNKENHIQNKDKKESEYLLILFVRGLRRSLLPHSSSILTKR